MRKDDKKAFVARFLSVTNTRIQQHIEPEAYPLLPSMYFDRAKQALDDGDFDTAFLLANTAITFSSVHMYLPIHKVIITTQK